MQPKKHLVLVATCALLLVAGAIGSVVATQSGGSIPKPRAAQTTATPARAAEPTVPNTDVDEQLDDAEPSDTPNPGKRRVVRRVQALEQERRSNTEQLQSGVTCDELGESDILVEPGADIDADGDGVGCES